MKIRRIITAAILTLGLVGVFGAAQPAYAINCNAEENKTAPACATKNGLKATGTQKNDCGEGGDAACGIGDAIQTVINVLLFIVGSVGVIMLIVGGIRYVISNGEASQIAAAKNTILYAVIGIIVSLLAYAIVDFVVGQFN